MADPAQAERTFHKDRADAPAVLKLRKKGRRHNFDSAFDRDAVKRSVGSGTGRQSALSQRHIGYALCRQSHRSGFGSTFREWYLLPMAAAICAPVATVRAAVGASTSLPDKARLPPLLT